MQTGNIWRKYFALQNVSKLLMEVNGFTLQMQHKRTIFFPLHLCSKLEGLQFG